MTTGVIVMLKPVELGKTRLRAFMSNSHRHALIYHMLDDVLAAVYGARNVDQIWLATRDEKAILQADEYRVHIFNEGEIRGINAAVYACGRACTAAGVGRVLVLPADVPLIRSEDIESLFENTSDEVAVVPSSDGTGTNALYLGTPNIIMPAFGVNSCQKHLESAKNARVAHKLVENSRIAIDVDQPGDLRQVADLGAWTKTAAFLHNSSILKTTPAMGERR